MFLHKPCGIMPVRLRSKRSIKRKGFGLPGLAAFKIDDFVATNIDALPVKRDPFGGSKKSVAVLRRYTAAVWGIVTRRAKQGVDFVLRGNKQIHRVGKHLLNNALQLALQTGSRYDAVGRKRKDALPLNV